MSKRAQFFKDYIKKQMEDPSSDPDEPPTPDDSDNDPSWDPEAEGNKKKLFFGKRALQFDETQTTSVGPKPFNKVSQVSNPENCPESIGKTYIELKVLKPYNIQAEECLPSTSSLSTEPSITSGMFVCCFIIIR
uniref:Uncharacterized protein n=1 Tax=Cacopsylla melanoneura TaxID=428564 RepID=A0A8D8VUD9_9HEMI